MTVPSPRKPVLFLVHVIMMAAFVTGFFVVFLFLVFFRLAEIALDVAVAIFRRKA